jgi:hypothetical protein
LIELEKALRPLAKTRLIDVTRTSREAADATRVALGDDGRADHAAAPNAAEARATRMSSDVAARGT